MSLVSDSLAKLLFLNATDSNDSSTSSEEFILDDGRFNFDALHRATDHSFSIRCSDAALAMKFYETYR